MMIVRRGSNSAAMNSQEHTARMSPITRSPKLSSRRRLDPWGRRLREKIHSIQRRNADGDAVGAGDLQGGRVAVPAVAEEMIVRGGHYEVAEVDVFSRDDGFRKLLGERHRSRPADVAATAFEHRLGHSDRPLAVHEYPG